MRVLFIYSLLRDSVVFCMLCLFVLYDRCSVSTAVVEMYTIVPYVDSISPVWPVADAIMIIDTVLLTAINQHDKLVLVS